MNKSKNNNKQVNRSYQYPPRHEEILLRHIHKFTLDRLTSYLANLFPSAELGIIKAKPQEQPTKLCND